MDFDAIDPSTIPVKCVIKGVPGTRKTTQAATFPSPIFWFDIDRKIESLLLPKKLGFYDPNLKIEVEQPTGWYHVEKKLQEFESYCPYATVVVDSLSSLGDCINRQTLNKEGAAGKKIGGIKVNTIEDFNAETSALMYMVDIGKKIKANFIVIAHVIHRDVKDPSGNSKIIRQLVTGGKVVGAKIPAYFPEVYHFEFDNNFDTSLPPDYVMYTQNHGDDFARTALPLPFKTNITKERLYDLIKKAQQQLKTSDTKQLQESKESGSW
jgi:hypothetical protein